LALLFTYSWNITTLEEKKNTCHKLVSGTWWTRSAQTWTYILVKEKETYLFLTDWNSGNFNAESYKWKYCKILGMYQFLSKCTGKYSSWILPTVSSDVPNLRHGNVSKVVQVLLLNSFLGTIYLNCTPYYFKL